MASGIDFTSMLRSLEQTGFYEVALPFLLIFTIVFAVLQKVKLFGEEDSKKYNVIIALVMAFLVVRMTPIVANINMFLPKVSWLVLVFIMALMLLGIFGAKAEGFSGVPFAIAIILSIAGIIWALSPTVRLPAWMQLTPESQAWIAGISVAAIIIYFVTKEPGEKGRIRQGIADLPKHLGRGGS